MGELVQTRNTNQGTKVNKPCHIHTSSGAPFQAMYFIVNPLDTVEVFDAEKSGFQLDEYDQTEEFETLHIRENAFEGAPLLLRPRHMTKMIMVSRELKDAMEKEGFTGNNFGEIDWLQNEGQVPPGPSSLAPPIDYGF